MATELIIYETSDGHLPFQTWLSGLKDVTAQARIQQKVFYQIPKGLGDWKTLEGELMEYRFDLGPGYRVYCGRWEQQVIILLCGGDKGTQSRDIKKAKEYWHDFKRRNSLQVSAP